VPGRPDQPKPAPNGGARAVNPAGPRVPRRVHPTAWALASDLALARSLRPYATAEARLVDGLARWVRLECTAPAGGAPLTPADAVRWGGVLAAVTATARLCGPAVQKTLARWTTPGAGTTAPGAAAGFVPGVDEGDGVG
jgi:hypothetical protein